MHIYLLRHGESEANAGLSDAVDCNLTEVGRKHSAALARTLAAAKIGCILSSPYRRCLQTAEIIRAQTHARAEVWPAVREHHGQPFPPGPWPLPTRSQLAKEYPHFAFPADMSETDWAAVPEDRSHQWVRLSSAVRELLERSRRDAGIRLAVVSHQAPCSVFVQAFCQWPNPLNVRVHVEPGSITHLQVDSAGRRHLVGLNWVPQIP